MKGANAKIETGKTFVPRASSVNKLEFEGIYGDV